MTIPKVTAIDLSNAYHDILENLVADILQTKQDWCEMKSADAKAMIRVYAAEIGRRLRGELMLSNARNRYLLDRIERTLEHSGGHHVTRSIAAENIDPRFAAFAIWQRRENCPIIN